MRAMRVATGMTGVLVLLSGCYAATRDIRTMSELRETAPAPLRLLAVDGAVYELTAYTVTDSTLAGSGTRRLDGERLPFSGTLRFGELVYIQAKQGGFWRTASTVCGVALVASWFETAAQDHGLRIYTAGEGSCPYIRAWDGREYALQGEAFGTSFGRALERSTTCMLPAVVPRDGALIVRITNERPETHYVNRVRLLAFAPPAGAAALLDTGNRAWPVLDPRPPLESPPALRARDGVPWIPAVGGAESGPDYRDRIELAFARPRDASAGSVIVHAVNTDLVYSTFELIFGYLGDDSLPFLHQLETDPELVGTLEEWIGECSLTVEVRNGSGWTAAGTIAPEASATPFSRIVRLDPSGTPGDTLSVRLSGLAGLWSIDAVEIDWSPAVPLEARVVPMRSGRHSDGSPVMATLQESDDRLAMLQPGDRLDLTFDTVTPVARYGIAYALEAGGYLHEWPPASVNRAPVFPASSGSDRVAVVNYLIRHRGALLPLVYEHWRHTRPGRRTYEKVQ